MSFRGDRLATLYLASPLRRLAIWKERVIPILMYHSVGEEDHAERHAYYRTAVSPATFMLHMEYLHRRGYKTCTLAQALSLLSSSENRVSDRVVITFDDGYLDFHSEAFPVLSLFGFSATVFLPTGFIGDSAMAFKGRNCLAWPHIRELQRCGIEFGSHTVTHPQLRTLACEEIKKELMDSKKTIEDKTGHRTESFAYPYAFPQVDTEFKKLLREELERAGYRNGVCTSVGRAGRFSDPLFLERLPLNDLDDEPLVRAKLNGAYDWVGWLQSVAQRARSLSAWRSGSRSDWARSSPLMSRTAGEAGGSAHSSPDIYP